MSKISTNTKKYAHNSSLREAYENRFLYYQSTYFEYANNYSNEEKKILFNSLGNFEFHFRQYVAGTCRNLHRVLNEVGTLKRCKLYPELLLTQQIPNLIHHIESDILNNELYELMRRCKNAKQKILLELY